MSRLPTGAESVLAVVGAAKNLKCNAFTVITGGAPTVVARHASLIIVTTGTTFNVVSCALVLLPGDVVWTVPGDIVGVTALPRVVVGRPGLSGGRMPSVG